MNKKIIYEKGSPAHFADLSLIKIKEYAKSELLVDRLIALNLILFSFVLGISILSGFQQPTNLI